MNLVPEHIAIIMDGNGRWAQRRAMPRALGHRQGAEAARRVTSIAGEMGIKYLTLFGFSSENWSRPASEITELMNLLRQYLRSETAELHKNGARLKVIGCRETLDEDIVQLIENAESLTAENEVITLVIALNYGSRQDMMRAAYEAHGDDFEAFQASFEAGLSTAGIPDPDLLIRTSGEQRISNFLLWECAYTELFFTDTLWPDFGKEDLVEAMEDYAARDRRYGGLQAKSKAEG